MCLYSFVVHFLMKQCECDAAAFCHVFYSFLIVNSNEYLWMLNVYECSIYIIYHIYLHGLFPLAFNRWMWSCLPLATAMTSPSYLHRLRRPQGTESACTSTCFPQPWSTRLWRWWASSMPWEPSCPRLKCSLAGSQGSSKVCLKENC